MGTYWVSIEIPVGKAILHPHNIHISAPNLTPIYFGPGSRKTTGRLRDLLSSECSLWLEAWLPIHDESTWTMGA